MTNDPKKKRLKRGQFLSSILPGVLSTGLVLDQVLVGIAALDVEGFLGGATPSAGHGADRHGLSDLAGARDGGTLTEMGAKA